MYWRVIHSDMVLTALPYIIAFRQFSADQTRSRSPITIWCRAEISLLVYLYDVCPGHAHLGRNTIGARPQAERSRPADRAVSEGEGDTDSKWCSLPPGSIYYVCLSAIVALYQWVRKSLLSVTMEVRGSTSWAADLIHFTPVSAQYQLYYMIGHRFKSTRTNGLRTQ